MMRGICSGAALCVCGLAVLCLGTSGLANTVTVTADARVVNTNWTSQNTGGWIFVDLWRGLYQGYQREDRSFLKFDLSSALSGIPSGAVIDASLKLTRYYQPPSYSTLFASVGNDNDMPMEVHLITRDWTESQVTWLLAKAGTNWTTPGGDYSSAFVATTNASPGADQAVIWDVTGLVKEWMEYPGSYFGMMLSTPSMGSDQKDIMLAFYSDEGTTDSLLKPTLSVTYAMPTHLVPEPVTCLALAMGLTGLAGYIAKRRRA